MSHGFPQQDTDTLEALLSDSEAIALKGDMHSKLMKVLEHARGYTLHVNALNDAGLLLPSADLNFTRGLVRDAFEEIIEDYCSERKQQCAPDSLACIEWPTNILAASDAFPTAVFSTLLTADGMQRAREGVSRMLDSIDWPAVVRAIQKEVDALEAKGHYLRCRALVELLRLRSAAKNVVFKSGSYRFNLATVMEEFTHRSNEERYHLAEHLAALDEQGGTRLADGVAELASAVHALPFGKMLESRATFGKGTDLELVCFKSKTEVRMTPEGMEALHAYVSLWGSPDHKALMAAIGNVGADA